MNTRLLVTSSMSIILVCYVTSLKHNQTELQSREYTNEQSQDIENATSGGRYLKDIYEAKVRNFKTYNKLKRDFNKTFNRPKYKFPSDSEIANFNKTEIEMQEQNSSSYTSFNQSLNEGFDWRKREDGFVITPPELYPYSVLIVMVKKLVLKGICTGSLLTEEWVLTASHCLQDMDSAMVYAGGNSYDEVKSDRMPPSSQLRVGARLIVHPLYTGGDNDVALVKVDRKFEMTSTVGTVRLATTPWSAQYHTYTTCYLTGFGIVQIHEKNKDDERRKTSQLEVKSPCICSFRLKMLFGKKTASHYICTKPKKDYGLCPGDSGGGLVCDGVLRAVAIQLVKLSDTNLCDMTFEPYKCGGPATLSIFEDICPYLPWVNKYVHVFNDSSVISSKCKLISLSSRCNGSGFLLVVCVLSLLIYLLKI